MGDAATWAAVVTSIGAAGVGNVIIELLRIHRDRRKQTLEVEQTAAQAPLVKESLALGNVERAIAVQQKIIDQQAEHMAWQDREIAELREAIRVRDEENLKLKADVLEVQRRLGEVQARLDAARRIGKDGGRG